MEYFYTKNYNDRPIDVLIFFFRKIAVHSYFIIIIIFLIKVTFKKRNIIKLFEQAYNLHKSTQPLSQNVQLIHIFYKYLIKISLDLMLVTFFIISFTGVYLKHRNVTFIVYLFAIPVSLVVYCFISSIYYITLAYAYFLMKCLQLNINVSCRKISKISLNLTCFTRKVNKFFGLTLLFYVFYAFMELVIQVKICIIRSAYN